MNLSVMLHSYKSNQMIDHRICSLHQTSHTLTTKSLVRAQAFPRANGKRGPGADQSVGHLNSIRTRT